MKTHKTIEQMFPEEFEEYLTATDDPPRPGQFSYVTQWPFNDLRVSEDGEFMGDLPKPGLLLFGKSFLGKTTAMWVSLKIHWADWGWGNGIQIFTARSLQDKFTQASLSPIPEELGDLIKDLSNCDLLAIDEFEKFKFSDFLCSVLFEVIEARRKGKRPILLTSNLTSEELVKEMPKKHGEPIVNRIRKCCQTVNFDSVEYSAEDRIQKLIPAIQSNIEEQRAKAKAAQSQATPEPPTPKRRPFGLNEEAYEAFKKKIEAQTHPKIPTAAEFFKNLSPWGKALVATPALAKRTRPRDLRIVTSFNALPPEAQAEVLQMIQDENKNRPAA